MRRSIEFQQVYTYVVRARRRRRQTPAPEFYAGLLNAIALSVPLWLLIAWAIRTLA